MLLGLLHVNILICFDFLSIPRFNFFDLSLLINIFDYFFLLRLFRLCELQMYSHFFEIFLKFFLSNTLRIQRFDQLFVLIFLFDIEPSKFMVHNILNASHRIDCGQDRLVKSHIDPFLILFEMPVFVSVSVFPKYVCSYAYLERFFINFVDLSLFLLYLCLNLTQLILILIQKFIKLVDSFFYFLRVGS